MKITKEKRFQPIDIRLDTLQEVENFVFVLKFYLENFVISDKNEYLAYPGSTAESRYHQTKQIVNELKGMIP